jgi:hypothetical protein
VVTGTAVTVLPVGRLLIAARCAGRCPDTLICGSGCDPGFACCGSAAFCATAAVVFRIKAARRVEKAGTRTPRPRRRPLKLTGNTSRLKGDKRPVTAILADEVRFRPLRGLHNNRTKTRQDTPPDALARDRCRWQISWLAGRCLRPPSQERRSQWHYGRTLTAYSCGGSRGIVCVTLTRTHRVPF